MFKNHTSCRVCNSPNLEQYLDLGLMPLSNNLLDDPGEIAPRYPLRVMLCPRCGLSQLSIVIDPQTLFGHYVYRSSISQSFKDHCREMAHELAATYQLGPESFHIDIAGNDGALLVEFRQVLHHRTLSVDPAANLAPICEAQGIRAYQAFWGLEAAEHLAATGWPRADLITATNVFAHVDDVKEFLTAVRQTLAPGGVLVLEFPYLLDFIDKGEFDTVYFEHLSYFSIVPLAYLCIQCGLELTEVSHQEIHGGSVRCHVQHKGRRPQVGVQEFLRREIHGGYADIKTYYGWARKVDKIVVGFNKLLDHLKGAKIYGFAASAKGNTLLNVAGVTVKQIPFIVDQTPEKVGKYSPGTGIPIIDLPAMIDDPPEYLVLLAWNFAEEVIVKTRRAGYLGHYIMPLTAQII